MFKIEGISRHAVPKNSTGNPKFYWFPEIGNSKQEFNIYFGYWIFAIEKNIGEQENGD